MIGLNPNLVNNHDYYDNMTGTVWIATITEQVDYIHAYLAHAWGGVGPMTIKLAIYDWDTGTLLGVGSEITMPDQPRETYVWYNSKLNQTVQITAGKRYYLCAVVGGADFVVGLGTQQPLPSGDSFLFSVTLDANSGLNGLPPATLLGNVKEYIPPWITPTPPTCPVDTMLTFGVCSYMPYKKFAIYADLSGGIPTITVSPSAATILITTTQTLLASPMGGTLPYTSITWTNEADGSVLGTGASINVSFMSPGNYNIRATVVDSAGLSAFATAQLTVKSLPGEEPPYPMPPLPEFPNVPDPMPLPTSFLYTMDKDVSGNYFIKDQTGTVVYSNTNPQLTLQQLITLTANNNAASLVKNIGTLTMTAAQDSGGFESILKFNKTPMKIYLESGVSILVTVPITYKGILRLDGRWETDPYAMRNGCVFEGKNGRAKITGQGSSLNELGVYIRCVNHLQLRHLEITHIGMSPLRFDADAGDEVPAHNDDNYFEDLYIHGWSTAAPSVAQAGFGMSIDGSRNTLRNILVDGESLATARCGINIWAENLADINNIFEDIEVKNIQRDGIYFCSDSMPVSLNFLRRAIVTNTAQQGGYSAIKFRNAYYNLFEDVTINITNSAGLTLGTAMNATSGDDGLGGPHDGWSRGNRFRRVRITNCRIVGMNMDIDLNGLGVEQNYIDAYIANCGLGVWFNNGIDGSSWDGINRDNTFFITIENCANRAIDMGANLANGALTYRNRVTGVVKNCPIVAWIRDAGAMDNYFDLVIIGGGTITDSGTRNRWNGVGKLPSGQTVPVASEWNNGDIAINQNGTLAWLKVSGAMQQLSVGQAIAQFTYMEGKGGLAAGTAQFIDKSFVSGRTIASWLWDFGDGATSTLQHPTHDYAAKGYYNVTLTITDSAGAQTTVTQQINVSAEGPVPATITLNVTTDGNGTVSPSGSQTLTVEQTYQFTATGNTGYAFDHWTLGAATDRTNPLSLQAASVMDGETLTAHFISTTISLTVVAGVNGSVSPSGTATYNIGQSYQFVAIPNSGYQLDHWDLGGLNQGSTNPIAIVTSQSMDGKTLTAMFTALPPPPPDKQYLTIASVNGQTNPTAGTYEVDKNTSVIITCTPNSGYRFKEWLLDNISVSTALSYTILMDVNHGLVAVCEAIPPPPTYTLFISASIGGTTHPAIGTYEYVEGTVVNVAPIPDNGYRFVNWTLDGQTITDNPINVTMNADHSLMAVFEALPPPPPEKQYLTIVAINGQTNPATGTYEMDKNSLVTITATPNSGYRFKEWLLDNVSVGTSLSIVIAMDANHTVVAVSELPVPVQAGIPIWVIPVALLGAGVLYLTTMKK